MKTQPPIALPLALLVPVLLAASLPSVTQEPDEDIKEVFGEAIQVNVVNVEVFASDKTGRSIPDLTIEDFEIFEDGKPMEITNFTRVVDRKRILPETLQASGTTEAKRMLPLEPQPIAEDQRLRLVVYIDNVNIRRIDRKKVMDELRTFLYTNVDDEDRVMLVSNDRSFKVRQPFTDNLSLVVEALEEVDGVIAEGSSFDYQRQQLIKRFDEFDDADEALLRIRIYADSVFHTLNRSIDTLNDMVDFLAGLPGRKAVLHVSSGIPMIAAAELFSAVEARFSSQSAMSDLFNYDASRRFEELGATANTNGVTFYTLDAGGLRPNLAGAAETPSLADRRVASYIYGDAQANLQDPLVFLADETGGRAIINSNEILPALNEIGSDFHTYYSLGYSPGHFGTGRLYNIKVKTKRKDVRLRHRRSYRDKNAQTLMHDRVRAALLHVVGDNPLSLDLLFGRPVREKEKQFIVPVQVRIPVQKIVLLPRGDYHVGNVRLFIAAMDAKGGLSGVEETPLGIRIPNEAVEAAQREHWLYTHRLLMGPGQQSVAVGVRDELGAESAIVTRGLVVN